MRRLLFRLVPALLLLPICLAASDGPTWVRMRYEVKPGAGVPAASYTVIQKLEAPRDQRRRVLFTVGGGEHPVRLRVDLRVKGEGRGRTHESRWLQAWSLDGSSSLALTIVAGQVELLFDGELIATWGSERDPDAAAIDALAKLAGRLPASLAQGLEAFTRVGLARETGFEAEARVLARALFPEALGLPFDGTARREVMAVVGFDPRRHPPLPEERPFGPAFGIPGA
ncbi:MAG: hypothetical protein Q9Q40_08170 [Acidobacteriota bacterium]|nr:hypothetical protein [Acidobacteriota bacterium]